MHQDLGLREEEFARLNLAGLNLATGLNIQNLLTTK